MKLGMALFRYLPFGGVQKDFLRIAEEAHTRGHEVTLYTSAWKGGDPPDYLKIVLLPGRGLTGHTRMRNFFDDLAARHPEKEQDLILGMNCGPGLDACFAGNNCFALDQQARKNSFMKHISRRSRTFCELEKAVFDPKGKTRILYLVDAQKQQFRSFYGTPENRFYLLPPGLNPDCIRKEDADKRRYKMRFALSLNSRDLMLVCIGTNLRIKGADRVIKAVAALHPSVRKGVRLYLIGKPTPELKNLPKSLGIGEQVFFEGLKTNVPEYLLAADLMVHPARDEAAGAVIIEALASGLPVICTDNCGFHPYVRESGAGCTVSGDPFDQEELNAVLESVLFDRERVEFLRECAIRYSEKKDLNGRARKSVDLLEKFYAEKHRC